MKTFEFTGFQNSPGFELVISEDGKQTHRIECVITQFIKRSNEVSDLALPDKILFAGKVTEFIETKE